MSARPVPVAPAAGTAPPGPTEAPATVVVAAALAFSAASSVALAVLVVAAFAVRFLGPVLDTFDDQSVSQVRSYATGWGLAILALCAVADVATWFAVQGRRWSQVVLLVLALVAVLGGLVAAAFVLPLLVAAAGVAVLVLLLLPESRRWFAASG
ncbi:MAG: hypothetical protein JWR42_1631 [Marmoricola sp.]|nr:hypothetical protein [Marmoricola sp.]